MVDRPFLTPNDSILGMLRDELTKIRDEIVADQVIVETAQTRIIFNIGKGRTLEELITILTHPLPTYTGQATDESLSHVERIIDERPTAVGDDNKVQDVKTLRPRNKASSWSTPDRDELLIKLFPTLTTIQDICRRLNELPGVVISDFTAVSNRASLTLKVKRPPEFMAWIKDQQSRKPRVTSAASVVNQVISTAPLVTKEPNLPSTAAREDAKILQDLATNEVKWRDIEDWAIQNKISVVADKLTTLRKVNEYRWSYGLPKFTVNINELR